MPKPSFLCRLRSLPSFFQLLVLPRHAQGAFLGLLLACWAVVFVLTRLVLLVVNRDAAELNGLAALKVMLAGLVFDLAFLVYVGTAFALLLFVLPRRVWRLGRFWLWPLAVLLFFGMGFVAAAEWLFWDEFGVRFNFIAVDYLVYSKEVVNNIVESYPLGWILGSLLAVALIVGGLLRRPIARIASLPPLAWRPGWLVLAAWLAASSLLAAVLDQAGPGRSDANVYRRELAANGPYQFFAAFRNNEIDYTQFYAIRPDDEVAQRIRAEVAAPNARFVGTAPIDIRRQIDNPGTPRKLNVILVTIESLSARYLGVFGNDEGLTPNLDALARQSLFFSNFHATGTRTDRGLEAITLSVPPTPGRSIVKRIGHESGYASLGYQFARQGYDTAFVYGGRGYFDNMNAFFSGNGYRIVDQSSVPDAEIGFENAWGMSDEDLYAQAMKQADADHAAQRPFFLQLMTTSNHRPYTYPAGRIDIPSGSGRAGAVKYTDYAIGQFLAAARNKPWFAQTMFIFVADHNAGSAGRQELPVDNYRIPLLIYSPAHVPAREVTTLASQIDLAPTLLGLLGFDYVSAFFGRDLLLEPQRPGRALIGNYQQLGLFDGKNLAILGPRRSQRLVAAADGADAGDAGAGQELLARAIAYYQSASEMYRQGRLLPWAQ